MNSLAIIGLSAAVAAQAPVQPYPLDQAFALFEESCGYLRTPESFEARVSDIGWSSFRPQAGTPVARLSYFLENQAPDLVAEERAEISRSRFYKKFLHGNQINLLITPIRVKGRDAIICHMLDFNAPEPNNIGVLRNLRIEKPEISDQKEGLMVVKWKGNLEFGELSTRVSFVQKDHAVAKLLGSTGLSFKISYLELNK